MRALAHLSIVRNEPLDAPVRAWLVPGRDPAGWLEEIGRWGLPFARLTLFAVPAPSGEAHALLVILSDDDEPAVRPLGQPLAVTAGRVVTPLDARLSPPATDDEIAALAGPDVLLLLPGQGAIGYSLADALKLDDLVEAPPSSAADWSRAREGAAPLPPLASARAASGVGDGGGEGAGGAPALRRVFHEEESSLGRGSPPGGSSTPNTPTRSETAAGPEGAPTRPPHAPRDASSAGDRTRAWSELQGARALEWMSGGLGGSETGHGFLSRLHRWASSLREQREEDIDRARNREIHNLLRLLEEDPERGLRYALPLGGSNAAAPPPGPRSTRLSERAALFDLSSWRSRRGAAGDPWKVMQSQHEALRARYHELARQEIGRGNPRRAAYILAELLADIDGAASVLREHRYFREAAVLYREELRRPLAAAECLEQGGLLEEAGELYVDLEEYQRAAEVYERLGDEEVARSCWRAAVEKRLGRQDRLAAARLLEERLHEPEEALATLAAAWPESPQARVCQVERFQLLGRLGRHEASEALITQLRDAPPPHRIALAPEVLQEVGRGYPDPTVMARARDATKVLAGRALPRATPSDRAFLLRALSQITEDDPLWAGDCRRYGDRLRRQDGVAGRQSTPKKRVEPSRAHRPRLLTSFQLPRDATWTSVAPCGQGFVAAGISELGPVVVRASWSGEVQRADWRIPDASREPAILIAAPELARYGAAITLPSGRHLPPVDLPETDHFRTSLRCSTPTWLPDDTLALGGGASGELFCLREGADGLSVALFDGSGNLQQREMLPPSLAATGGGAAPVAPRLLAKSRGILLSVGPQLTHLPGSEHAQIETRPLPAAPSCLAFREPLVAACVPGAILTYRVAPGLPPEQELEVQADTCVFTPDALLVAAGADGGSVFALEAGRYRLHASFDRLSRSIAALPVPSDRRLVAFVTSDGSARVYRIP